MKRDKRDVSTDGLLAMVGGCSRRSRSEREGEGRKMEDGEGE